MDSRQRGEGGGEKGEENEKKKGKKENREKVKDLTVLTFVGNFLFLYRVKVSTDKISHFIVW